MNELKVNLENLTKEERKQLIALLEKSQQPKKTGTWFPEKGELYWFVTSIGAKPVKYGDQATDREIFAIQDPCQTKCEANKKFERNKALVAVNRQVRDIIASEYPDYKVNWNLHHKQLRFYPVFNHNSGNIDIVDSGFNQHNFLFEHAPLGAWTRIDKELIKKAMGV